jgi:hypothetical protein
MKQLFAFILSLSLVVVVTASTSNKAATTFGSHASIVAKKTFGKNNDHKAFAHTNTNAHQQPVGKTKVAKQTLSGFSKENISSSYFSCTSVAETDFTGYRNIEPSQRLYVLHCTYLL